MNDEKLTSNHKSVTDPLISVVIPVYSRPELIAQGLDSIFSQNFDSEKYEVLAVNNGAIDPNVEKTLQEYKFNGKRPSNLRVIEVEKNNMVGTGRNAGIKAANGRFIIHKDHDDQHLPGTLERLFTELSKTPDIDILLYDYQVWSFDDDKLIYPSKANNSEEIMSGDDYLLTQNTPNYLWHEAFRRDFLLENNLMIKEGAMIDDADYIINAIMYAEKVRYAPFFGLKYYKFGKSGSNASSCDLYRGAKVTEEFMKLNDRLYEYAIKGKELNHPGYKKLLDIHRYYFKVALRDFLWTLPLKDMIRLTRKYPVRVQTSDKQSNFAMKHTVLYSIGVRIGAPFYRWAIMAYRKFVLKVQVYQ